jgi:hypothetical protein
MLTQTLSVASNKTILVQPSLQASTDSPSSKEKESDRRLHSIGGFTTKLKRGNLWALTTVLALGSFSLPRADAATSFSGLVKGGLAPISGATVKFYAVGHSGYGLAPALLAQTTSDSSGAFSANGYTCPVSNPETYLLAMGGNAGNGSNSAIGLMALTGKCQSLMSSSFVTVNELTTVAAQWTLAQFVDVGGTNIGTSPGNAGGLGNAVAGGLADLVISVGTGAGDSGIPAPFLPAGSQCSLTSAPSNCDGLERLNSLANILSACVLSSGPSSSACNTLFKSTGTPYSGTTLEAAHQTVTHPKRNVKVIWGIQSTLASLPYLPSLASPPDGWELALLFTPASAAFNTPVWVALDGPGNVWIVNGFANIVSELPAGNYNDGATNFTPPGAAFSVPFAVALDTAGNVFVANAANNSVSELPVENFNNGAMNFAPSNAAFNGPAALALDKANNIWVANLFGGSGCNASPPAVPCGSVSELRAANYSTDGVNFASSAAKFDRLLTIAVDSAGNVWTANDFSNSITELTAPHRQAVNFAPASAGFDGPLALALDASNNVWVANSPNVCARGRRCGSLSELPASNRAAALNFAPAAAAIDQPNSVAVDSNGNLWVSNAGASVCVTPPCGSVSELAAANPNKGAVNFAPPGAGFVHPTLLALDASGNVWVSQFTGVSELIGLASPVLTPIQACLKKGKNLCRP